jgi:hypothetical protein
MRTTLREEFAHTGDTYAEKPENALDTCVCLQNDDKYNNMKEILERGQQVSANQLTLENDPTEVNFSLGQPYAAA